MPSIVLNNVTVSQTKTTKYLSIYLDSRLTRKHHIRNKLDQIRIKRGNMHWLTSKNSKLSVDNKLLIYKVIIKPVWTYGIELWVMAAKSHICSLNRSVTIYNSQNHCQCTMVCTYQWITLLPKKGEETCKRRRNGTGKKIILNEIRKKIIKVKRGKSGY